RGRRPRSRPTSDSSGRVSMRRARRSRRTPGVHVNAVNNGSMNVVHSVSKIVLGRPGGAHRATTWAPRVPAQAIVRLMATLMTAVTARALTTIHRRFAVGIDVHTCRQVARVRRAG